jgi:hypothetical protein
MGAQELDDPRITEVARDNAHHLAADVPRFSRLQV